MHRTAGFHARRAGGARPGAAAFAATLLLLLLAATGLPACDAGPAEGAKATASPRLVPLPLLLGSSKYRNAQLSPDATRIAYVRPTGPGEAYNVFVKRLPPPGAPPPPRGAPAALFEREGVGADAQVTFDDARGVTDYSWTEDGGAILYTRDENGDENDHLYIADMAPVYKGEARAATKAVDLTPFKGVAARGLVTSRQFPGRAYILLNRRDKVRG